ncbi:MAG: Cytosine/purine/uracil/thiamine/allantoin permease family protein [Bacteroidetes bacterium]|nr:Cytosine/purine/uracil/thiamine/allantoin permease family protein [Bacteroidota bacterium]
MNIQATPELVEVDLSLIEHSPLINDDIAPTKTSQRKWGIYNIAALWISMSACIPTYMLASSLISEGMNWYQAVITVFLGNAIVLIPMMLNAHAGTKYGIPFPVYCRASFGVKGANVPALLRAFVACGWFGIQSWIGGWAIYKIITIYVPSWDLLPTWLAGINIAQFACFMFFWGINMIVIYKGIESIRFLLDIKAPLLIVLGLVLLGWAYEEAGGFGPMLSQPSHFEPGGPKAGQFWNVFFPSLTGMIGFWATLSLNIPDFTRYARTQRDQMLGQAIGLPTTMALYSFIGVAVTSATIVIYGGLPIWDPVVLITRFTNPVVLAVSLFALCLATLATNLAANVVSPANDFANLWPSKITFRIGGLITGIIGILIQPWKLVADPSGYIFTWLVGYSALLGPIGGILICDYFVIRKKNLLPVDLYLPDGGYSYRHGFNPAAIVALILGIVPNIPGFLGTVKAVDPAAVGPFLMGLYNYAWFVGFGVAFSVYFAWMRKSLKP